MPPIQRINCPLCSKDFGQEAKFVKHLLHEHEISNVKDFYVKTLLDGKPQLCGCGCGAETKWKSWKEGYVSKYVRGHNAQEDSCWFNKDTIKKIHEKRSKGYADGLYKVWNAGLNKQNSEKINAASQKISDGLKAFYETNVSANLGKTKHTHPGIMRAALDKRQKFLSGEIKSWNQGFTKHTHKSVLKASINNTNNPGIKDKNKLQRDEYEKRTTVEGFTFLTKYEDYTNKNTKLEIKCNTCGSIFSKRAAHLSMFPVICRNCHPISIPQYEIYEYVKSLTDSPVTSNDRSVLNGLEADIHVHDHKLLIEFNGNYWHSEQFVSDQYHHQNKMDLARSLGYKFLAIFEDEWRDRQDVVKSMLAHRLSTQKNLDKASARKCSIREMSNKDVKDFLIKNHLEGHTMAIKNFCLEYNNEIVACVSLRRPFHKKYGDYIEIARFASSKNVPGWIGKLTKRAHEWAASEGYKGLMTYVDSRVGTGESYKKCGW